MRQFVVYTGPNTRHDSDNAQEDPLLGDEHGTRQAMVSLSAPEVAKELIDGRHGEMVKQEKGSSQEVAQRVTDVSYVKTKPGAASHPVAYDARASGIFDRAQSMEFSGHGPLTADRASQTCHCCLLQTAGELYLHTTSA
jgi:hypothetical protein